jgi:hypothetical protein
MSCKLIVSTVESPLKSTFRISGFEHWSEENLNDDYLTLWLFTWGSWNQTSNGEKSYLEEHWMEFRCIYYPHMSRVIEKAKEARAYCCLWNWRQYTPLIYLQTSAKPDSITSQEIALTVVIDVTTWNLTFLIVLVPCEWKFCRAVLIASAHVSLTAAQFVLSCLT